MRKPQYVGKTPSRADLAETHRKFHDLARQSYPDVGEPGAVWVLCEVLGWEFEKVTRVAVDGFSKTSYRLFVVDSFGRRELDPKSQTYRTVTRGWTKEEKALLRDWWWLLGF